MVPTYFIVLALAVALFAVLALISAALVLYRLRIIEIPAIKETEAAAFSLFDQVLRSFFPRDIIAEFKKAQAEKGLETAIEIN